MPLSGAFPVNDYLSSVIMANWPHAAFAVISASVAMATA